MRTRLGEGRLAGSLRRLALGAGFLSAASAQAQTFSVSAISAQTPNLGTVVSAASGVTVFTVAPDTGTVTRKSGGGMRITTGSTRAVVTIACGNQGQCNNAAARIRIGPAGTTVGRGRALSNFTVAGGSAQIISGPTGSSPIDFVIGPVGKNSAKTFYVGADVPIAGSDSGSATGAAAAGFYVYVAANPGVPTSGKTSGLAVATVLRPLSVTRLSDLTFGTVVRPPAGLGGVGLDPGNGLRSFVNGASGLVNPAPTLARFKVAGEGGRSVSIDTPSTVVMTNSANQSLTAVLVASGAGARTLSSTKGRAGSLTFAVGGSFALSSTTPAGAYAGTFTVMVNYD